MLRELSLKPQGLTLLSPLTFINTSGSSTRSAEITLQVPHLSSGTEFDLEKSLPFHLMLLSEDVLAKDWDTPEEDETWAHL